MNRLSVRLALTYALVAIVSIAAVLSAVNVFVEGGFQTLATTRIETELRDYTGRLSTLWSPETLWRAEDLDSLGMEALTKGYVLRLDEGENHVIWDARQHNAGLCVAMLDHMALIMSSHTGRDSGKYQERLFPVTYGGNKLAILTVGLYGPVFFNDNELAFINDLRAFILAAGAGVLVLALLGGWMAARWMARPLVAVTEAARRFRHGQWEHPPFPKTTVTELVDLSSSIRSLGENLQNQELLRRRLTADVSHELRSPLAIVQARLEALIDGVQATTPEVLESVRQEILRLTRLVGQLEQLTRAERPDPEINRVRLSSRAFLESMALPLGVSVGGDDVEFWADADATRQILVNLLTNAVNYTPPGGRIEIRADRHADDVVFSVSDTGVGIAPADLPFIFERFYRSDASRTRATGGTGLGLSIATALAHAQKGTLEVESQVGVGSTFRLILPQESRLT